jgi:hypothetical protein
MPSFTPRGVARASVDHIVNAMRSETHIAQRVALNDWVSQCPRSVKEATKVRAGSASNHEHDHDDRNERTRAFARCAGRFRR